MNVVNVKVEPTIPDECGSEMPLTIQNAKKARKRRPAKATDLTPKKTEHPQLSFPMDQRWAESTVVTNETHCLCEILTCRNCNKSHKRSRIEHVEVSQCRFSWFKVSMKQPGHAKKMLSETSKLGVQVEDILHALLPSSNPNCWLHFYTFKAKSIEDEEKLKTAVETNFVRGFNAESLLGNADKSFFFHDIDMRSALILCTIATFLKHWKIESPLPPMDLLRDHEHFSKALADAKTFEILDKYVSRNGMKKLKAWDSDTLW